MLVSELGIVVLSPSQLVEQAVQQYLSEKPVLEAQLLSTSHDEDNPLINSTNEGDDGGNEAEGSGMIDDVFVDNAGSGANEENPAINAEGAAEPENGGIPVTTSGEEGGGEEEEEEEGEGGDGKEMTTEESSPDDDLPPYFSEVQRHHFQLDNKPPLLCLHTVSVAESSRCSWLPGLPVSV